MKYLIAQTQFVEAYKVISKLTSLSEGLRKRPTPIEQERIEEQMQKLLDFDTIEKVDDAVFDMLGKLGIYL